MNGNVPHPKRAAQAHEDSSALPCAARGTAVAERNVAQGYARVILYQHAASSLPASCIACTAIDEGQALDPNVCDALAHAKVPLACPAIDGDTGVCVCSSAQCSIGGQRRDQSDICRQGNVAAVVHARRKGNGRS